MVKYHKKLTVKCPNCEKEFSYYDSKFRPFCCERCRMIDLGQWLEESYRVPSKAPIEGEDLLAAQSQERTHEEE